MTTQWLLFGRSENDDNDGPPWAYWWPMWVEEQHGADSAEEMLTLVWDRLALNQEEGWVEIAVVPADGWATSNQDTRGEA